MNQAVEAFLNDVWTEVTSIYAREHQMVDRTKKHSPLQAGIRDFLRVAWRRSNAYGEQGNIHIDIDEPFSWSDSSYTIEAGPYIAELTDELLSQEFFPALYELVDNLFRSDDFGPYFFDYQFQVVFEFEGEHSELRLCRRLLHEQKLAGLQKSLEDFIQTKVLSDPPVLPKAEDMFFFAYHLMNPDLMKQQEEVIEPLIRRLSDKLQQNQQRKREWIGHYTSAFDKWAQEHFLPQYFVRPDDYGFDWKLKEESIRHVVDAEEMDFFLYIALQIGFTKPDTRQKYLELAGQLGSMQALQYLKVGSGKFRSTYRGERVEGSNNDVTQTIEIRILAEEEKAYGEALDYIINLLQESFPKGYQLKLKTVQKHFLPLHNLAKSKLHQFFANALSYPALFPKLAEYADLVMEEFAWYRDVVPGEKSVMPGTYAVFGLGLYSESYFPLVCRYMELVDTEHQMVQDSYAQAFIDAHGVKTEHMPILTSILLGGNEEARPVKNITIDRPELAEALIQVLKNKKNHECELVLCRIFGSADKLARAVRQAHPPLKEGLEQLSSLLKIR
ncbi:hypothetical protein H1230_01855 [Paenibacillus sp. 19GGS1-52]|uniref:DUF6138 family protein n=1 Tax=Paenibacillus sp. 19GGS1-52 TaxID=2758563 RepID=UPI001EFA9C80|nr:DUF6138 family protein [Paenibacillus sp. 19GGS1-52]ULO07649.1 hypothetical protein H1230_01855 [Paenibacillus sp. 19GGS1-52]